MTSIELAEYIIIYLKNENKYIIPIILNPIIVLLHMEYYIKYNAPLIKDEHIELIDKRYCFPNAYYKFCGFGGSEIHITSFFKDYKNINWKNYDKKFINNMINTLYNQNYYSLIREIENKGLKYE